MSVIGIQSDFTQKSVNVLLDFLEAGDVVVPIANQVKDIKPRVEAAQIESLYDIAENKFTFTGMKAVNPLYKEVKGGFVLFSSGTTGPPKAALHDYTRFISKFDYPGKSFRTIMFLLFDHIGGWNTLFYTLRNGTPIYISDRSPGGVCRAIAENKAELLPSTPSFLNLMLLSGAYKEHDLSSLKLITYGTEPMPPATLKALSKALPDVKLKQTYGLSELGIMRTKSGEGLWLKIGDEHRIVNGRLWIKSKTSMVGYLNAPSPFKDGWYDTGDLVDEKNGYIRFRGRDSDIINVGGYKVSPIDVESCILEIPGIKDVTVKGEPNPILGQVVIAKVVGNVSEKRIKTYVRHKIGKFHTPMRIEYVERLHTERFKRLR